LSQLFKAKLDYRLGALEKDVFMKKVLRKEVLGKTLEWGNPAQVRVFEKEKFGKSGC
jgi:hypothetical protein